MLEFFSPDARLAFVDEPPAAGGRGEPILLIHGFASNHAVNWYFPQWVKTLTEAGRRVIAFDNRGHGRSEKFYEPEAYGPTRMAEDARALLDHLDLETADVMGYSMGARIAAFLTKAHPNRVRSLILGGLGHYLVEGGGLSPGIAEAMEAPSLDNLVDPIERQFRAFAEATKSDLRALAACARGARQLLSKADLAQIDLPVLVATGSLDEIAGDGSKLASLFPAGHALDLPGRDHNRAVGDKAYKSGALEFLDKRP
ncbi:alpha/beta fold hydrolase [Methylocapsa acidiphila]|uniref:alpha/beta fold hydrolase n=1 Tax=Methylocapsa acidiphila TaxID=133552 RepID=UPI00040156E5|nr:alpha/beta fold hydrolase [Methylocapsa acidiphila]